MSTYQVLIVIVDTRVLGGIADSLQEGRFASIGPTDHKNTKASIFRSEIIGITVDVAHGRCAWDEVDFVGSVCSCEIKTLKMIWSQQSTPGFCQLSEKFPFSLLESCLHWISNRKNPATFIFATIRLTGLILWQTPLACLLNVRWSGNYHQSTSWSRYSGWHMGQKTLSLRHVHGCVYNLMPGFPHFTTVGLRLSFCQLHTLFGQQFIVMTYQFNQILRRIFTTTH